LLVIGLGLEEFGGGPDFVGDPTQSAMSERLLVGAPAARHRGRLLRRRRIAGRAILGAHIIALPHALGRVMLFPEGPEQPVEADYTRVINHFDRFGMTGSPRTDFFIGRIWRHSSLIAGGGHDHARQLPEQPLRAPE